MKKNIFWWRFNQESEFVLSEPVSEKEADREISPCYWRIEASRPWKIPKKSRNPASQLFHASFSWCQFWRFNLWEPGLHCKIQRQKDRYWADPGDQPSGNEKNWKLLKQSIPSGRNHIGTGKHPEISWCLFFRIPFGYSMEYFGRSAGNNCKHLQKY